MSSIYVNNGTEKLRGLENAALQHLKHADKKNGTPLDEPQQTVTTENNAAFSASVDIVELGKSQPAPVITYSKPLMPRPGAEDMLIAEKDAKTAINRQVGVNNRNDTLLIQNEEKMNSNTSVQVDNSDDTMWTGNGAKVDWKSTVGVDNGNDAVIIGNGAKVEISGSTDIDNGNDTLIVGNGAKVSINSTAGTDNGNDILIIGNGAKVSINSSAGTDNGNNTLIIGNGAKVELSGSTGIDNSDDILIIGNGAKVEITGGVGIDSSNGIGITYLDGKVRLNLVDEKNQSFQMEWQVKNKEEAATLQELIQDKMKKGKLNGEEFSQFMQDIQENMKAVKTKKENTENDIQLKKDDDFKAMNRGQLRLSIMQSLVQNLVNYQSHTNNGLHKGLFSKINVRV